MLLPRTAPRTLPRSTPRTLYGWGSRALIFCRAWRYLKFWSRLQIHQASQCFQVEDVGFGGYAHTRGVLARREAEGRVAGRGAHAQRRPAHVRRRLAERQNLDLNKIQSPLLSKVVQIKLCGNHKWLQLLARCARSAPPRAHPPPTATPQVKHVKSQAKHHYLEFETEFKALSLRKWYA